MSQDAYAAQQALRLAQSGANYVSPYSATGSNLGNLSSGAGIVGGIQQGGVQGDTTAAVNAGKLYGHLTDNSGLSQAAGGLNNVLQIYNGIQKGGVAGYGGAAANSAQLAGSVMGNPALSAAGGYIAAPLAVYNAISNWQSGKTGSDAINGAEAGAAVGSIIPGIGTLIGGVVGGAVGALSSAFGNGAVDPENAAWNGYTDAYNSATAKGAKGTQVAAANPDPYLSLAGLFDLRKNQITGDIPFYNQYGRMGEQKFTTDMTDQINSALKSGTITAADSSADIMNKVVNPWINSMGKWDDPNKQAQEDLLQQMVGQYTSGQAGSAWKAIGGDTPFAGNLQPYGGTSGATTGGNVAAQTTVPQTVTNQRQGQGIAMAARGGHMRKVRYDDGGDVDYGSPSDDPYMYDVTSDLNYDYSPDLTDLSGQLDNSNPYSDINQEMGSGDYINAQNDPSAYGIGVSNPSTSQSAALGSLLKSLGISGSTASALAPYAAALPLLNSLLSGSQSNPALPSQYSGTPLNIATPANQRTATNPNMPMSQWLTAGERPEMAYYNQNALPATAMSDPNQQAAQVLAANGQGPSYAGSNPNAPTGAAQSAIAAQQQGPAGVPGGSAMQQAIADYGYNGNPYGAFSNQMGGGSAPSGSPSQAYSTIAPAQPSGAPMMTDQPVTQPRPVLRAMGGPADPYTSASMPGGTGNIGHVHGPGDGTSDSIKLKNAYLSDGEYVVDAPTVSLMGNGSNDAGAKWLDGLRKHVRMKAGQHLVKGKQPMSTNVDAGQYAYGGVV